MTAQKTFYRSFAAGELGSELFGHVDLVQYHNGLASCENFVVLPHGPIRKRSGFRYIQQTKFAGQGRLIPFTWSEEQTMVLEFGNQYIRFHTSGGTLLESEKSIINATHTTACVITTAETHGFSAGDWVYIRGVAGLTTLNGRYFRVANPTAYTFELRDLTGTTGTAINTTAEPLYALGGTVARVYEVTTPYITADLNALRWAQSADVLTLTHPQYPVAELRRNGATDWAYSYVQFGPKDLDYVTSVGVTALPLGATGSISYRYTVTPVNDAGDEMVPWGSATVTSDLSVAGQHNKIDWIAAAGAVRYKVYRQVNGVWSYIGWAIGTTFTDDNITPDAGRNPPEETTYFHEADDYPSTVVFFEQRRCFASTVNNPHGFWATRIGSPTQLDRPFTPADDDPIAVTFDANQQNAIRYLISSDDLIGLATSGVWKIGTGGGEPLGPYTITAKMVANAGTALVPPALTESAILYAQNGTAKIRELAYSWESQKYQATDATIMVPHLTEGTSIRDMAYSSAPYPILWCALNNWTMNALTYVPEQNIRAWHHHTTDGIFTNTVCVRENGLDVLYAIVYRQTTKGAYSYIERMEAYDNTSAGAFFVDSGLKFSNTSPVSTISGLWHLEGKTVSVLADGNPQSDKVVSNGSITLDYAASAVTTGLKYRAIATTLPQVMDAVPGMGIAAQKNVNKVHALVKDTSTLFAGPDLNTLTEYKSRSTENYNTPTAKKTGYIEIPLKGRWNDTGQITLVHDYPLPCTIVALQVETAAGG